MAPLIRVIGSLNADMVSVTPRFPDPGETITSSSYFTSAGGKGANQAVACGRMSRSQSSSEGLNTKSDVLVEMVGAVGELDGHFSALLKPTLEKSGVDPSRVRVIENAYTGVAVIIVDSSAGGENRIVFSPGANYDGMQPISAVLGTALAAPVPDVIVLQGEIPVQTVIGILREVNQYKAKSRADGKRGIECGPDVMLNPAPAPPGGLPEDVYAAVDHLILNETEAELMTPPADQLLRVVPDAEGLDGKEKVARYFHKLGVTYGLIRLGARVFGTVLQMAGQPVPAMAPTALPTNSLRLQCLGFWTRQRRAIHLSEHMRSRWRGGGNNVVSRVRQVKTSQTPRNRIGIRNLWMMLCDLQHGHRRVLWSVREQWTAFPLKMKFEGI